MNRRPVFVSFCIVFFFVGLVCALYYFQNRIVELREHQASLSTRLSDLEQETDLLLARRQAYTAAFNELDRLNIGGEIGGASGIDFYSEAQEAIKKGGSRIISNSPGRPAGGKITMGVSLTGDYYAILRSLSELRALRSAIRVVSMTLVPSQPAGDVKVDVMLEAPSPQ